jgi:hypothetical protein
VKLWLRHQFAFVSTLTLLLTIMSWPASAQISKGSISGTVEDPSGAAVADAEVKATEVHFAVVCYDNRPDRFFPPEPAAGWRLQG